MHAIRKIARAIDKNIGTFLGGMCFGGMLFGWAGMGFGAVFSVALILYSNRKILRRGA